MDLSELAKKAGFNKTDDSPEKKIERLNRKVTRERKARVEAEKVIEEQSRRLHNANEAITKSNAELESANEELARTMTELTSIEVRRKAALITLLVAIVLFVASEFYLEPILERRINGYMLIIAKLGVLGLLVPTEIIVSRILENQVNEIGHVHEDMYKALLRSAYDDGIITEMERSLLNSSRKQMGISKPIAQRLENDVLAEREQKESND
jgi:hypothetical protein